jgi:hypothetical protein
MELGTLRDALEDAKKELSVLDVEFESLRVRKESISRLVASLREFLTANTPPTGLSPTLIGFEVEPAAVANWEVARDVLLRERKPMTVPELHSALVAQGINATPSSIRVALIRKPSIFERIGHGTYVLRKPALIEKEAPIEETS